MKEPLENIERREISRELVLKMPREELLNNKACMLCLQPIPRSREDFLCEQCRESVNSFTRERKDNFIGIGYIFEAKELGLTPEDYLALRTIPRPQSRKKKKYSFFQLGIIKCYNEGKSFIKCKICNKYKSSTVPTHRICEDCYQKKTTLE